MNTSQKRVRRLSLEKPLYLNANILYSECINLLRAPSPKSLIKPEGTLTKLKNEGYQLVTSILTRMEIMQSLRKEKNIPPAEARKLYLDVIQKHKVLEITDVHKHIHLTPSLCDQIGSSTLDFKDALHLLIAKNIDNMPVCTHDKKINKGWSLHPNKIKFYDKVYKPSELIKSKK